MLKKRLKNEDEVEEDDDGKKVSKSKKKKDFVCIKYEREHVPLVDIHNTLAYL